MGFILLDDDDEEDDDDVTSVPHVRGFLAGELFLCSKCRDDINAMGDGAGDEEDDDDDEEEEEGRKRS